MKRHNISTVSQIRRLAPEDRRQFLKDLAKFGGGLSMASLLGCAMRKDLSKQFENETAPDFIVMKDLFVMRFTTDPGKPVEVLPAANILAGIPTTFYWRERTHEHFYVFDIHHYEQLKRGETIVVTSNIERNHTHSFMIDPKVVVEGSMPVRVQVNKSKTPALVPLTPEEWVKLFG
jgi:hypothetical protein